MSRIPKEVVDQIIQAANLVEVASKYVQLKARGQRQWGCCPFHDERTPSFTINPELGAYKCFGCGASGGVVQFLMDIEGLSYPAALRQLAREYGVTIPDDDQRRAEERAHQQHVDALLIVLAWAQQTFQRQLEEPEGQQRAGAYLRGRGISRKTADKFGVGYSLPQWEGLLTAAAAAGHPVAYLEQAGLLVARDERHYYDRFRDRLQFPVHNVGGRVVGFGARLLREQEGQPKYLNSPESEVFQKGEHLYGLHHARQAIRRQRQCYLVEGYLDVLSLHQGGIENVVASAGTSLTKSQVKLLKRYTDRVTVLYDGDAAGVKASLRGVDQLLAGGLSVRVVPLPAEHDPDSYLQQVGDAAFAQYLTEHSQDFISFKAQVIAAEAGSDPVRRAQGIREVLQSIHLVGDALARQLFLRQAAETFRVEEALLVSEYAKLEEAAPADAEGGPLILATAESVRAACEREVVRLLVLHGTRDLEGGTVAGHLAAQLSEIPLETPAYAQLWADYHAGRAQGQAPTLRQLASTPDTTLRVLLADFATEQYDLSPNWSLKSIHVPTETGLLAMACDNAVLRLTKCHVQQQRQQCLDQMNDTSRDESEQLAALTRFQTLTQQDNQLAGLLGVVVPRAA